jgi:hypothetical protein
MATRKPARTTEPTRRRHKVMMMGPKTGLPLGNADMRFDVVDARDGKIGTLLVSVGAIEWKPFNSPNRRKYTWAEFDRVMVEHKAR